MPLWGIKFVDLDDRWWVDLIIQEQAPEVSYVRIGSQVVCDGFKPTEGRVVVRKASVQPADLSEWSTDTPVVLDAAAQKRIFDLSGVKG
ncbi:MAG TPA: hypothetical protein VJO34_02615 [Methylomirabilota bacterium]|nr:hypothetical protein [Methylomirabilota bacterium]